MVVFSMRTTYQHGLFKSLPKLLKKVIAYMNISILGGDREFFV